MNIEIFTKDIAVRRDLGNRVSRVDRAHMNRPLLTLFYFSLQIRNGYTLPDHFDEGKTRQKRSIVVCVAAPVNQVLEDMYFKRNITSGPSKSGRAGTKGFF